MAHRSHILLAHGGGGQLTDELIASSILPRLGNPSLNALLDSALLPAPPAGHRLAFTTDAYVVTPWRFAGGDIGRLAVCGTVNDLAVCGAQPLGLSLSLILAEGLPIADLETILDSIAAAAQEAGTHVVTGDTKVVGQKQADGIFITTAGIGTVPESCHLSPQQVRPGDVLLVNGHLGAHGLAVMLTRHLPEAHTNLRSDVAPLNSLTGSLQQALGADLVFMRDATRGGLAGLVADLARSSGYRIVLQEEALPISPQAAHAAAMLGLDILEIANEGKLVAVVRAAQAAKALEVMRCHPLGAMARIIGAVAPPPDGLAILQTRIGGQRIIQKPHGELLPRIC